MTMLRTLCLLVALLVSAVAAQAQITPQTVVAELVHEASIGGDFRGLSDLEDLEPAARIALFAGTEATLSLIELGDKSPLKHKVPALVWNRLLTQAPHLAQAADAMRGTLVGQVLEGLERHDLELPRTTAFAAGGMLLASSRVTDLLQKATLVYSARGVLTLSRESRIARKMALMAIDPRLPGDVRKAAGITTAVAAGVELQQTITEAKLLAELSGS